MKGPREEPEMSQNFSSGVNRMWRLLTSIVSIRDMFRGKNQLSPPEDAVDERLSHGKTDRTLEEPAMSTILQMWHLRFFPWTLHLYEDLCYNGRISRIFLYLFILPCLRHHVHSGWPLALKTDKLAWKDNCFYFDY